MQYTETLQANHPADGVKRGRMAKSTRVFKNGLKNVRNVIEMALKSLFLLQNHKNHLVAGGCAPILPL